MLVLDPERVRTRAHDLVATSEEFLGASWAAAASGGESPIDLQMASYRSIADVRAVALEQDKPWWSVSPFGIDLPDEEPLRDDLGEIVSAGVDVEVGAVPSRTLPQQAAREYRGDVETAIADVRGWLDRGFSVTIVHPGHGPAQRTVEVLGEHDVAARLGPGGGDGVVTVSTGTLRHGFVDETHRLAVLTGDDLTGQRASTRDMRSMPTRRKKQIDPLELKPGDFVVHEQHGVGRFVEMKQREVQGSAATSASARPKWRCARRSSPCIAASRWRCWCPPPPIPRTLEMAVTGIREMSTLATPPEERHPVLTAAVVLSEADL